MSISFIDLYMKKCPCSYERNLSDFEVKSEQIYGSVFSSHQYNALKKITILCVISVCGKYTTNHQISE